MNVVDLNRLTFEEEYREHPTLGLLPRYWHPCLDWLDEQGIQYELKVTEDGNELEDGWEPSQDGEVYLDIKVAIPDDQDAVRFKLLWADQL